jgi:hydrogenase nickel incorporation protein HypB
MCGVCGCGGQDATIEAHGHTHHHDHGHAHSHDHGHAHPDAQAHHHTVGANAAIHVHAIEAASPTERTRLVQVERDLLEANAHRAAHNRSHFAAHGVLALNLVSSPGAGKTTLLCETIRQLNGLPVGVIEGDQQTSLDAERIRATGAAAVQVNTGKGCHLDAAMVDRAFALLHDHVSDGVLFIENVGNLVCPAAFDLGETHRVVIASVTEGEDKPLKYPDIFASADLMIVNKADIADACGADINLLIANARKVKPGLPALVVSARNGAGMDRWIAWLKAAVALRLAAA